MFCFTNSTMFLELEWVIQGTFESKIARRWDETPHFTAVWGRIREHASSEIMVLAFNFNVKNKQNPWRTRELTFMWRSPTASAMSDVRCDCQRIFHCCKLIFQLFPFFFPCHLVMFRISKNEAWSGLERDYECEDELCWWQTRCFLVQELYNNGKEHPRLQTQRGHIAVRSAPLHQPPLIFLGSFKLLLQAS